jgi:hypothetical protein
VCHSHTVVEQRLQDQSLQSRAAPRARIIVTTTTIILALACAITRQAGCMHTRCSGTSSTEHATSIETGNGSSSPAPAADADAASASLSFSLHGLQQAGGGASACATLRMSRDLRPFLTAIERTCALSLGFTSFQRNRHQHQE